MSAPSGRRRPEGEDPPRRGERPSFDTQEAVLEPPTAPDPSPVRVLRPGRIHLVVVVTRAVTPTDVAPQT